MFGSNEQSGSNIATIHEIARLYPSIITTNPKLSLDALLARGVPSAHTDFSRSSSPLTA